MTGKKYFLLLTIILFGHFLGNAQSMTVKARLDSVNILMGKLTTLHLEVVENEGAKGVIPVLQNAARTGGYVTLCGDSVELGADYTVDTTRLGSGKIQLNYSVPVQVFDSGTYTLPSIAYVAGIDTAYSNPVTFNVYPVDVTADDEISGMYGVEEPDGKRFYDWVPDWILDFWWLFLVVVLAICISFWAMRNYRKKGIPFIAPKEQPKPWIVALDALERLKVKKLWEQGMEKEYFTDLTDILRVYLYERFGINAMEMTTRQIMDKIHDSDVKEKRGYVKQILNVADFVKFAKVRPLPADSIAAYDNAVKFVEETIPVSQEVSQKPAEEEGGDRQ